MSDRGRRDRQPHRTPGLDGQRVASPASRHAIRPALRPRSVSAVASALAFTMTCGLSLTGCDGTNYDPPTLIKHLRVLAVRADPPYLGVAPTTVSAFVVGETKGEELCFAWALCAFAWQANGNYECLDPDLQVDMGNDPTATPSLLDLLPALEKLPEVLEKKGFNPPTDVEDSTSGATDAKPDVKATSGLEVQLLFQVSEARIWGGTCPKDTAKMLAKPCPTRDGCMFGHKGLSVAIPSDDGKPAKEIHSNPTLEMVALNGVPWPIDVTPTVAVYQAPAEGDLKALNELQGLELMPIWAPESQELIAKSKEPGIPDRKERMIFSFFSTAGSFNYRKTGDSVPENGYLAKTPKAGAATEEVTLWIILRDGRGGTDWTTRRLIVDPQAPSDRHPLCGPDPSLPKCDEVKP